MCVQCVAPEKGRRGGFCLCVQRSVFLCAGVCVCSCVLHLRRGGEEGSVERLLAGLQSSMSVCMCSCLLLCASVCRGLCFTVSVCSSICVGEKEGTAARLLAGRHSSMMLDCRATLVAARIMGCSVSCV